MYKIKPYDIHTFAESGYGRLEYEVEGFWSSPVEIYVQRKNQYSEPEKATWIYSVSHSSGGKDTKSEKDDLIAETNFAFAILNAVQQISILRAQEALLEASYVKYREELERVRKEQEFVREQALSQDPGYGLEDAQAIMQCMWEEAVEHGESKPRRFYLRADSSRVAIVCERWGSKTVWKHLQNRGLKFSNRISKKEVLKVLMEEVSSVRNVPYVVPA